MPRPRYQSPKRADRYRLVIGIVLGLYAILLMRLVYLTIFDQGFLQKRSDMSVYRHVSLPAHRGVITDRRGTVLAMSLPSASLWVDPHECELDTENMQKLAEALDASPQHIISQVRRHAKSYFLYLARQIPSEEEKKVKALNNPCFHWLTEYHRYYPEGASVAPLLGITNVDDRGQEGLEWQYNALLQGEPGEAEMMRDRMGHVVAEPEVKQAPRNGQPIRLSIDQRLQFRAYEALRQGVEANDAKAGSVLVVDTQTGQILAMASVPASNPNNKHQAGWRYERNRVAGDTFEPGSTLKSISVSYALETGKFTPESIINTAPGWMMVDRHVIRDEHGGGDMTLTEILKRSSNVGMSKVVLELPVSGLSEQYYKFGFGQPTNLNLPGEVGGYIKPLDEQHAFDVATLAFGYGLSVTSLQLARAYSIIANQGQDQPLKLILPADDEDLLPPSRKPVVTPEVAGQVMSMLRTVVDTGGTGVLARVHGMEIAGKTGTASIYDKEQGYHSDRYISSFVGIAPYKDPRLVVVVVVNEPHGRSHYGGIVAAPIFARVMLAATQLGYA